MTLLPSNFEMVQQHLAKEFPCRKVKLTIYSVNGEFPPIWRNVHHYNFDITLSQQWGGILTIRALLLYYTILLLLLLVLLLNYFFPGHGRILSRELEHWTPPHVVNGAQLNDLPESGKGFHWEFLVVSWITLAGRIVSRAKPFTSNF